MANISDQNPTRIRLPEDLKAKLLRAAEDGHRSVNSEVVKRLEESFVPDSTGQRLDSLERMLRERGLLDPQLELTSTTDSVEDLAALAQRLIVGVEKLQKNRGQSPTAKPKKRGAK